MNLHEIIQIEADRLEKEVRELETRLEKAPKGSLRCHKNGKSFRCSFRVQGIWELSSLSSIYECIECAADDIIINSFSFCKTFECKTTSVWVERLLKDFLPT